MWIATWLSGWNPTLYVDIARHLYIEPTRVVTLDLDVDIVRYRDGTVEVLDRDEFEEHRHVVGYPNDLVDAVIRVAREIEVAMRAGQEPFHAAPNAPAHDDSGRGEDR